MREHRTTRSEESDEAVVVNNSGSGDGQRPEDRVPACDAAAP